MNHRADLNDALERLEALAREVPSEHGRIRLLMLTHRIMDLTEPWPVRVRWWFRRIRRRRAFNKLLDLRKFD